MQVCTCNRHVIMYIYIYMHVAYELHIHHDHHGGLVPRYQHCQQSANGQQMGCCHLMRVYGHWNCSECQHPVSLIKEIDEFACFHEIPY